MPGIDRLAYARMGTKNVDAWHSFAEVLGVAEGSGPNPEALYLRTADHAYDLEIVPGERDELVAIGWETTPAAMPDIRKRLDNAGAEISDFTPDQAFDRQVDAGFTAFDPANTRLEIVAGLATAAAAPTFGHGNRFVSGPLGFGHLVLPVADSAALHQWYTEVLGFDARGSHLIPIPGEPTVYFTSPSRRHHSLAFVPEWLVPSAGTLDHFMLEVETKDQVIDTMERLLAAGIGLVATPGRHVLDELFSCIVQTPGGWGLELGCESLVVSADYVAPNLDTQPSLWGHTRQWGQ